MKKIYINNLGGLYDELYNPDYFYRTNIKDVKNEFLDANTIFWHNILDLNNISYIVDLLIENKQTTTNETYRDLSIITNPNLFIQNVLQARDHICNQGITQQEFFRYIETLEILCDLYSRYYFSPYKLSLEQGIEFDEISSRKILQIAVNPSINPLYTWIHNNIFPILREYEPDIVFFEGRPSVFFITLAKMLKRYNADIKLCITRHSSEYFSLNKIDFCLRKNKYLFTYIDIIILEYFEQTEQVLLATLEQNGSLDNVNNIIYSNEKGTIVQNPYQKISQNNIILSKRRKSPDCTYDITPHEILNVHLEPYQKCYWNKCTFCGINKKYHFSNADSDTQLGNQLKCLGDYIEKHRIKYVWFIDEAIRPDKLRIIANYFIEREIYISWQARCRVDSALLQDELPRRLAKSGLRELRLGLESGSKYILKLMQKFDDDFSFELLEQIVSVYDRYGISVHVPIIIGFPGESDAERQKTYELLTYLKEKYDSFTFNINILGLDVSSMLFQEWYKYDINAIHFPCPKSEYLGNLLEWESDFFDYETLDRERNSFMRKMLYPWMPQNALCRPYLLYRFSETIRNTLIWKSRGIGNLVVEKRNYIVKCSDNSIITPIEKKDMFFIYQWSSHHYIKINKVFLSIYAIWKSPKSIEDGIAYAQNELSVFYSKYDLLNIIFKLIVNGFLIIEEEYGKIHSENKDLEHMYDNLYLEKIFPYAIRVDNWLIHYENQIPIGTALEIGIGTGKNIPMLLKRGYNIHGIDISEQAISNLKKTYSMSNCLFIKSDIRDYLIEPNTYDLIVCSMVLHYIDKHELVDIAAKIQNGLKKNGHLFVSVLSANDPLNYVEPSQNIYVRTFFTNEMIKKLFNRLQIVELSDTYSFEAQREHPDNYFGLILYMGKKR